MKKGRKYNREEIEIISKSSIGKSISDLAMEELKEISEDELNKGSIGTIVEQYLFGMETNNESEPDFMPAGIELKVTPYKKLNNGDLSAKERLVLNIIDYESEYKNDFKHSHFWFKNNTIQILWYLWEAEKERKDYIITNEKLLELSKSDDLFQIEKDWNCIVDKIKAGKADEISEADTMYLGACTKGANKESLRKQPFSNKMAMQRAFCFKNSYMTQLVRKYIGKYSDVEKILKNTKISFDEYVKKVVNKYRGKTQNELLKELCIKSSDVNPKNLNSMIISRMFGVKNINRTDEFLKANIYPKTIRIEKHGHIKESMSFPAFSFQEIYDTEFENSSIKAMFETSKYMFFIFQKENDDYYFKDIKLWNMPELIINKELREVYDKTREVIKSGNVVKCIDSYGKKQSNFPGMSFNGICHVRPHGRNASDVNLLPVPDRATGMKEYTKQCFWLNNTYIESIVNE